jgi:excisionase family DNA binding protein
MSEEHSALSALPPAFAGLAPLLELLARRIVELEQERAPAPSAEEHSPWLSLAGAAAYLDFPRARLYKLSAAAAIPHYKQEGRLLFRRDELDRWLAAFAQGERR